MTYNMMPYNGPQAQGFPMQFQRGRRGKKGGGNNAVYPPDDPRNPNYSGPLKPHPGQPPEDTEEPGVPLFERDLMGPGGIFQGPHLEGIINKIIQNAGGAGTVPGGGDGGGNMPTVPGAPSGPSLQQFHPTSQDLSGFADISDRAINGSIQSFDRAANRLRERLDSAAQSAGSTLTNQGLSSGFQGALQQNLANLQQQKIGQYGQGLTDLERDFEASRLEGLGIANNAQQYAGQLGLDFQKMQADSINNFNNALNDRFGTEANIFGTQADIYGKQLEDGNADADRGMNSLVALLQAYLQSQGIQSGVAQNFASLMPKA